MSNSLWPHGLQHARLPCPPLSPGVCSHSCWLSWWCHPTMSSSVIPFSSYPQSFPASGSFPMSQLFASGGQSIGASTSGSVLPMNVQGWFLLGLIGLISLQLCCCSVTQSCLTLGDLVDCSTPGLPVPPHLPKFAQVHVHCIDDAIQPSHPLMPSSSALNFPSIRDFSSELAVLIRGPKYWSFIFSMSSSSVSIQGWFPLRLTSLISLCPRDFEETSPAPQFKGINSLAFCLLYSPSLTTICDHWEDHSLNHMDFCWQSYVSTFQHTVDFREGENAILPCT